MWCKMKIKVEDANTLLRIILFVPLIYSGIKIWGGELSYLVIFIPTLFCYGFLWVTILFANIEQQSSTNVSEKSKWQ